MKFPLIFITGCPVIFSIGTAAAKNCTIKESKGGIVRNKIEITKREREGERERVRDARESSESRDGAGRAQRNEKQTEAETVRERERRKGERKGT